MTIGPFNARVRGAAFTRPGAPLLLAIGLLPAIGLLLAGCQVTATELHSQKELSDVTNVFKASRYLVYEGSDERFHYFKETGKFGPLGPTGRFRIAKAQLALDPTAAGSLFTYDQNAGAFRLGQGRQARVIKADFTEPYTREEEKYLATVASLKPHEAAAPSMAKSQAWLQALRWAFHAGHFEEAARYSHELLAMEASASLPDHGSNRIHEAHTFLGLVALKRNDVAEAGRHLLASAEQAPPTPTLTSFGPRKQLARQLALAGQWEVVARYLALCERFWPTETLRAWQAQVQERRVPDTW